MIWDFGSDIEVEAWHQKRASRFGGAVEWEGHLL